MTTKDEALKMALNALEFSKSYLDDLADVHGTPKKAKPGSTSWHVDRAITACRAALAQKDEQEPALWKWILRSDPGHFGYYTEHPSKFGIDMSSEKYEWTLFYTAPPKRQPLTDVQISHIWDRHIAPVFGKNGINPVVFARAIEDHHGIGVEHEPR